MQTTCNNCQTLYRIVPSELTAAKGIVICSVCMAKFNAYKSLEKKDSTAFKKTNENKLKHLEEKARKTSSNSPKFFNFLFILLLLILLPLQFVVYEKYNLLQNPILRKIAVSTCSVLPCSIASFKDNQKIKLISRKVYSHPLEKKALIITATIMNTANEHQPFPKILISMANIQGRTQAQRLFEPTEYLPDNIFADQKIAPNIPLNINLDIVDPGQDLVAFEIDFL